MTSSSAQMLIEFVPKYPKRAHNRRTGHIDKRTVTFAAVEIDDLLKLFKQGWICLTLRYTFQHRCEHRCLHAACRTLPAGFPREELRDAKRLCNHARVLWIEPHDTAAQQRTRAFERLRIEREIELIVGQKCAGRPSRKNCFKRLIVLEPATYLFIEQSERSTKGKLVSARRIHLVANTEDHRARTLRRSVSTEP